MNNYPNVSIIILNWNGLKDTIECLESVFKSDYKSYEVIVVDNGSTDDSARSIQKQFPRVTIVVNKTNLGYAGGNNIGITRALDSGADYVWLLNNDSIVEKDSLRALIEAGESSNTIGLASPVIYDYPDKNRVQFCGAYIEKNKFFTIHLRNVSELTGLDKTLMLWGTALLIKRNVFERIGYFNEKYFAYAEDFEYSFRAVSAGYSTAVVSNACVYHKNNYSPRDFRAKIPVYYFFYMARNRFWLWQPILKARTEKIKFMYYYFARILRDIAQAKEEGNMPYVDAILDGAYCAFRNRGGPFNDRLHMPKFIKYLMLLQPGIMWKLLSVGLRSRSIKQSSCCCCAPEKYKGS